MTKLRVSIGMGLGQRFGRDQPAYLNLMQRLNILFAVNSACRWNVDGCQRYDLLLPCLRHCLCGQRGRGRRGSRGADICMVSPSCCDRGYSTGYRYETSRMCFLKQLGLARLFDSQLTPNLSLSTSCPCSSGSLTLS